MGHRRAVSSVAAGLIAIATLGAAGDPAEHVTVTGTIHDLDGRPVQGAEVYFYYTGNTRRPADFISPHTDALGRYRVVLSTGPYWAVARVRSAKGVGPLAPNDRHSGAPERITLRASKPARIDFVVANIREMARMPRKVREDHVRLSGRIVDADNNAVSGHYVMAHPSWPPTGLAAYISAWTTANGGYTLHLPAGRYHVAVAATFPPQQLAEARVIEVKADAADVDLLAGF